jgi:hypothetical protein
MTMRSTLGTIPLWALLATVVCADDPPQIRTADKPPTACHGTTVEFMSSPVEAAKLAAREKKLVLVLHVSGHFEDPDFT